MLAALLLALHIAIIAFNIFGLFAIPLGAWRGWAFVRRPIWRLLHLGSLGIVALQAALGRACFLTIWQDAATGRASATPLIMRTINALIYWPLPIWVFAAAYFAIFCYVAALWWLVPVRWRSGGCDR
ncbi:MAG: DUF2784 family protein [Sphingomonadaceae bacterium]|nr:DUF2784 family protein [Sphingomonadaceae bacterium]